MQLSVKETCSLLLSRDNFVVIPHANPDGDALGSAYGLCSVLQKIGKQAKVDCADQTPEKFHFMLDAVVVQDFEPQTYIAVDSADPKLLGANIKYLDDIILCIDHHVSNLMYAKNTLLDTKSAATAEIIFDIAKELGVELDIPLAKNLYTGIATDTGCFKYSNTTPRTHRIVAELTELKFSASEINYKMFDLKSKSTIMLERMVIEKMGFFADEKIAVVVITDEMIKNAGFNPNDDFGGVSSLARQIEGVEVGVTLRQKGENHFKASVRTSGLLDASQICANFGGGGHPRAAGCEFFMDGESAKQTIAEKIIAMLDEKHRQK